MSLFDDKVKLDGFGYEKISHVGRGHYATVQLVRERATGGTYVSKCVSLAALSERDQDSAHQEVFLLQSLRHPLIVEYHNSFLVEGANMLVIVMEYCGGGDLRQQIVEKVNSSGHFSEDQVMSWFTQTLMALQYIHSEKVLHRDLKTSNIFLATPLTDGTSTVKLGDFGISRILEGTADAAITMVGTPYYMSPEVCRNEPYNWKSDVWSLGCVLYELCMLKHAFESQSLAGLIYKIISDTCGPIPSFYSPALSDLIRQLLTKSADLRPCIKDLFSNIYVKAYIDSLLLILNLPSLAVSSPKAVHVPSPPPLPLPEEAEEEGEPLVPPGFCVQDPRVRELVLFYRIRLRLILKKLNWISAFAPFDEVGDGHLPQSSMQAALVAWGPGLSHEEAATLVANLAPSPDAKVPLSSFALKLADADAAPEAQQLAIWAKRILRPRSSEVAERLGAWDVAKNGVLSIDGFRAALRELFPELPVDQSEMLVLLADKSPSGDIDYMHFADVYAAPPPPPPLPEELMPMPPPAPPCEGAFVSCGSKDFVFA